MSDLKAKAEARRAKILARDSSKRTVSAITEDEETDLNLNIGPTTPKERPLAARRSLVMSAAKESDETAPSAVVADGGDAAVSEDSAKESESKLPPKKSLEEIEREVAENTAKFDAKTLDKAAAAAKTSKPVKIAKSMIDPAAIMRLVRVGLIVLLAGYAGYRTVQTNLLEAQQAHVSYDFPVERSWAQWGVDKLHGQLECSVTAVSLVWYLSRMVSPMLSMPKAKPSSPLNMVMDFLKTGFGGLAEGVYTTLGEMAFHLVMLVLSVVLFTVYFSNAVDGDAMAAAAQQTAEL